MLDLPSRTHLWLTVNASQPLCQPGKAWLAKVLKISGFYKCSKADSWCTVTDAGKLYRVRNRGFRLKVIYTIHVKIFWIYKFCATNLVA
jgi:hypothetical protein